MAKPMLIHPWLRSLKLARHPRGGGRNGLLGGAPDAGARETVFRQLALPLRVRQLDLCRKDAGSAFGPDSPEAAFVSTYSARECMPQAAPSSGQPQPISQSANQPLGLRWPASWPATPAMVSTWSATSMYELQSSSPAVTSSLCTVSKWYVRSSEHAKRK